MKEQICRVSKKYCACALSNRILWTNVKVISLVIFNKVSDVDLYFGSEDVISRSAFFFQIGTPYLIREIENFTFKYEFRSYNPNDLEAHFKH